MALLVGKEKSRTMKFDILSPSRTLNLNSSNNKLDIINKNILYLTHEVDKCVSMLRRMEVDAKLQHQVTEYFDDDLEGEARPGRDLPLEDNAKDIPEDSDGSRSNT